MSAILEALVEQLFTAIPVDEHKFPWFCSGCAAVGVYCQAPSDCCYCGTKDLPALTSVNVQ